MANKTEAGNREYWQIEIEKYLNREPYSNRERERIKEAFEGLIAKYHFPGIYIAWPSSKPWLEWKDFLNEWVDLTPRYDVMGGYVTTIDRIAQGLMLINPEMARAMVRTQYKDRERTVRDKKMGLLDRHSRRSAGFFNPDFVIWLCWVYGIRVERLPDEEYDEDEAYADEYARDEYRKDWYDYQEEYIDNWDCQ